MEQMFDFCQGMCYTEKTAAQARKLTVLARIAGALRQAEVTWAWGLPACFTSMAWSRTSATWT